MIVCDRCRKELDGWAFFKRYIKMSGLVVFSNTVILCQDCWRDFKQFMEPVEKLSKEEVKNGNK